MKPVFLFSLLLLLFACSTSKLEAPKTALQKLTDKISQLSIDPKKLNGAQLAQIYCGTCHMMPDPKLLDKSSWKNSVLPNMAFRMGLKTQSANPYNKLSFTEQGLLIQAQAYSSRQLIDSSQWMKIVKYYIEGAPDTLGLVDQRQTSTETNLFAIKDFYSDPQDYPLTTLVKYDSVQNKIYVGSGNNHLQVFDPDGTPVLKQKYNSPPVDIYTEFEGQMKLLTMGQMHPSNQRKGIVFNINSQIEPVETLVDSLPRAVSAVYADLNGDSIEDIVVCGFGHDAGTLTWHENLALNQYKEHILSPDPGAIKAVIRDFNQDGKLDILALMAQGMERFDLYTNVGNGDFEVETLISFPPIYGSLYFELADFNEDGHLDILYVNGDNADYSIAPKNYHGLRIFENDGSNNFIETHFLPMYGATKAMSRDFDLDEDLDILAISFFPEYDRAITESILYFENENETFNRQTIANNNAGHWLVMDIGDLDQDGDEDVLLGSCIFGIGIPDSIDNKWKKESKNVFWLENQL